MSTLDENGILQYDESDTRGTFSALLNMGQEATSDAIGADRGRLSVLEAGSVLSGVSAAGVVTAASGWKLGNNINARKKNGLAFVRIDFERTGGNISVPASGDIGDELLGTFLAGWQPAPGMHYAFTSHTRVAAGYLHNSSGIVLTAIAPANTLNTGTQIGVLAVYPLA